MDPGRMYRGKTLHVRDPEEIGVTAETCIERGVMIQFHYETNTPESLRDTVDMEPEEAILLAERIISVAREVMVRRVLRE